MPRRGQRPPPREKSPLGASPAGTFPGGGSRAAPVALPGWRLAGLRNPPVSPPPPVPAGLATWAWRLVRWLEAISTWTGQLLSWLSLGMVVVTFLVVVLRYLFDLGWIAMQESVTYMHALLFMLGAAYTLRQDGHVRVDLFYQRLSRRGRAWVDLLGTLLLLGPVCLFIAWVGWRYVADSWSVFEGSREAGGIPAVYLLKTLILVMPGLLLLQALALVVGNVLFLAGLAAPPGIGEEDRDA